jgi:hypothetical protein
MTAPSLLAAAHISASVRTCACDVCICICVRMHACTRKDLASLQQRIYPHQIVPVPAICVCYVCFYAHIYLRLITLVPVYICVCTYACTRKDLAFLQQRKYLHQIVPVHVMCVYVFVYVCMHAHEKT